MPAIQATVTHVPMDWVIIALFAVLCAIFTMRSGTGFSVAFSLAAPLALFAASEVSYTAFIGSAMMKVASPYVQAGIFGAFFLILLILIYMMLPKGTSSGALPLPAVLAGVSTGVILAIAWLQIPAFSDLVIVSPLTHTIFGASYRLFWLVAAYIMLAIARW